ncbi:hypothetical protein BC830DRAFT_1087834 [Chytriomyces sp. MP71]|nr:hypothetical protein BC830DRAFT_1087834 [Chytriomyces sp. MP71]
MNEGRMPDDDVTLPLTVLLRILRHCDVATVSRCQGLNKRVREHLCSLGVKEANKLWTRVVANSDPCFWADAVMYSGESTLARTKTKRAWLALRPSANHNPIPTLAPVQNLQAAILGAMKNKTAVIPKRTIVALDTTFSYLGAMKQIHLHTVASVVALNERSLAVDKFTNLLFIQSTQPRNLQITNLQNYSRVTVLLTQKKPFLFRILNWSHTPFIYFVDRDTYQRRMWFYDSELNSIFPVAAVEGLAISENIENPIADASNPPIPAATASGDTLIDPFSPVVDSQDASVNDQFVGFGNVVVWWTWIGGDDEDAEDNEDGNVAPMEEEEGPRGPRQYELKVQAYTVQKDGFLDGLGVKVQIIKLWEHNVTLTGSKNVGVQLIPYSGGRVHLHHYKKFHPKADAEIVSLFSFNLLPNGGLIEDECITEDPPVIPTEWEAVRDPNASPVYSTPPPLLDSRHVIGARANNARFQTRFHTVEVHEDDEMYGFPRGPLRNLDPAYVTERLAVAAARKKEEEDVERDILLSIYSQTQGVEPLVTARDPSLGKTKNKKEVEMENVDSNGKGGLLLSLVPVVKNIWRPGKRQVSLDGSLLVVAGVEGARRCLRIVDVSRSDAVHGVVRGFYLDDEMGVLGPKRKKVGGGVWIVEKLEENGHNAPDWKVTFLECGGIS